MNNAETRCVRGVSAVLALTPSSALGVRGWLWLHGQLAQVHHGDRKNRNGAELVGERQG